MQRKLVYILLVFCLLSYPIKNISVGDEGIGKFQKSLSSEVHILYNEMNLESIVCYDAFEKAMTGYNSLTAKNKSIFTIIDFSKPSVEERLCVIDMTQRKVLHKSHVSHGRNSGENYATDFSNKYGSYKSSLGFYVTESTYFGNNGYSLVLDGLERGINDNAKARAIVIHGADYCDPALVHSGARLGRSLGCPALPRYLCKPIINTIKDGTLLFIYAEDKNYLTQSPIVSPRLIAKAF